MKTNLKNLLFSVVFLFGHNLIFSNPIEVQSQSLSTVSLFSNPFILPKRSVSTEPLGFDRSSPEEGFSVEPFLITSIFYPDKNKKICGSFFSEPFFQQLNHNFTVNFEEVGVTVSKFFQLFGRSTTEEHKIGFAGSICKYLGQDGDSPVFRLKLPLTLSVRHFYFLDFKDADKALLEKDLPDQLSSMGFSDGVGTFSKTESVVKKLKDVYWDFSISDVQASVCWPFETGFYDIFGDWGFEFAFPISNRVDQKHKYLDPKRRELKDFMIDQGLIYDQFFYYLIQAVIDDQPPSNAPIPFAFDAILSYVEAIIATRLELSAAEDMFRFGPIFHLDWFLRGPANLRVSLFGRANLCPKVKAQIPIWTDGVWQPSESQVTFASWPIVMQSSLSAEAELTRGLKISAGVDFYWRKAADVSMALQSFSPALGRDLQNNLVKKYSRLGQFCATKVFGQIQFCQCKFKDLNLRLAGFATVNSCKTFADTGLLVGLEYKF